MPHATIDQRPATSEYAPYYGKYIALVSEQANVIDVLERQGGETVELLRSVPEALTTILHPPYTWTIKQVINHLTDGERIFAYRALRIGRGDTTPLEGFDENTYAKTSGVERLAFGDIIDECEAVRRATVCLLRTLPAEAWPRMGVANGKPVSVRALAWIMAGHERHHVTIVRARLSGAGKPR